LLQLPPPCPPTPITAIFSRPEGEQLIRFGIKTAPAPSKDADLIKSRLVGFMWVYSLKFYIGMPKGTVRFDPDNLVKLKIEK
jgi:hypothetical protein